MKIYRWFHPGASGFRTRSYTLSTFVGAGSKPARWDILTNFNLLSHTGQIHHDQKPARRGIFRMDTASVGFDDAFADGKSQS